MSDALSRTAVAVLLLTVAGCAGASNLIYGAPTTDRVEALREAGDYDRALATLDRLRRDAPDSMRSEYADLDTRIHSEGEAWAISHIDTAGARERAGDWEGAAESLEEVRQRYAVSDTLVHALAAFDARRTGMAARVEEEHALARAHGLLDELPMLQELARVRYEDRRASRAVDDTFDELDRLHAILLTGAERALEMGEKVTAEQYLTTAARIDPSQVVLAALTLVREPEIREMAAVPEPAVRQQQQQDEPSRPASRPRQPTAAELAEQSLDATNEAMVQNDLLLARSQLERAERYAPASMEVAELKQELNRRIASHVQRLDELGRKAYVEGHYESASESWKRAIELDPDNETIAGQLARVERVLENLRRIREGGDKPPPPPPASRVERDIQDG